MGDFRWLRRIGYVDHGQPAGIEECVLAAVRPHVAPHVRGDAPDVESAQQVHAGRLTDAGQKRQRAGRHELPGRVHGLDAVAVQAVDRVARVGELAR